MIDAADRPSGYCTQTALEAWLDRLAGQMSLLGPREVDDVLLYHPVNSSAEIAWGFGLPVLSAKESFFPPTEQLLQIEKTGQHITLIETLPEGEGAIFGIRPCDARGLKVLDALFLEQEPIDPYYARRRRGTVLIGLACNELGGTCFCDRLGGAPDAAEDMDVMLYETDQAYWVQVVTARGQDLLADFGLRITEGLPPARSWPARQPVSSDPHAGEWRAHFDDDDWARTAERCLGCRICAYVCPTCRCFVVRDEPLPAGSSEAEAVFERIRCWDSCARENYRQIAGGYNPRPEAAQRLRNRVLCKYSYYPQQYGPLACTGCGRCVESCPVNIDIEEILDHFMAAAYPRPAGRG